MKKILIGREGNQPFAINDEYVSRQHAIFTYDETTGIMTLTDNSRPEIGTYVKMGNIYQRVSQCNVSSTTEVRLGPYFVFRISQLFQSQPQPNPLRNLEPKVEKINIAHLRKVTNNYEDTKIMLEQKQANINSLRSLSLIGTLAAGCITAVIPKMFGQGEDVPLYIWFIGPAVAVVFLISLWLYCSKASKEIIVRKNENEKLYKTRFVCPKCRQCFAGKIYENILAEGKCPKCKTRFYERN